MSSLRIKFIIRTIKKFSPLVRSIINNFFYLQSIGDLIIQRSYIFLIAVLYKLKMP